MDFANPSELGHSMSLEAHGFWSSVRTSTKVAGVIPLSLLALFYLYAASVRIWMGGFSDPGSLPTPFRILEVIIGVPLLLLFPLAVLAVPVLVVSLFPPFARMRNGVAAFLVGAAVVFAVVNLDPGGIFTWFMD
jgi:hypothetical protein